MDFMAKADVLVAEDDAVLRNLYVKKFSISGYVIRTVEDGEAAIKEITEHPPEVLILDIHMPKLDGFQVLERYPRAERGFPVILLTNFADERSRQRGVELGADEYFVKKDMTIKTLLEMTEKVLYHWKQEHAK